MKRTPAGRHIDDHRATVGIMQPEITARLARYIELRYYALLKEHHHEWRYVSVTPWVRFCRLVDARYGVSAAVIAFWSSVGWILDDRPNLPDRLETQGDWTC